MLNMVVRQNTSQQIGVVWLIVCSCISFTFRELMATVCSDAVSKYTNDSALRMCESGNAVGKQIFMDTFDSAMYGKGICNCDMNFITNETTTMNLSWNIVNDLLPGSKDCDSGVFISDHSNNLILAFPCVILPKPSDQLDTNISYRVVWDLMEAAGIPGYCVRIESQSSDVSLNITCIQTDRPLITTSTASPTETSTTASKYNETTETSTTPIDIDTSTQSSNITTPIIIENETTIFTTQYQQTTASAGTSSKSKEKDILMTILVPAAAAGGGIILLLTVIVLIVMCKRKEKATPEEVIDDPKSGMRVNTLYVSADDVADIEQPDGHTNNGFLTDQDSKYDTLQSSEKQNEMELSNIEQPQGALYAVVNKKSKSESVKEETPILASSNNPQDTSHLDSVQKQENQNEMEFQNTEQSQGALYAVVNKKNESGSVKDKTPRASSYKNQAGLNYTRVEVNSDSSRSSKVPSVRIASKDTEGDKVTYSEVTIGD